ncbi:hypothetical protein ACFX13_007393 [Malus domestica]|uniref:Expansin-like EG45 domain-containing protein n=1 Tax=Malus domestica TaxID=3750 RepID=A0A498II00_MALDO|nr:hypothetical protein DVH24_003308 [Malus domestica]
MPKNILVVLCIVASFIWASVGTPGIATFYSSYIPSACYGNTPQGILIAAAGDAIWNNGAGCGKFYNVKCTGPRNPVPHPCTNSTVRVKIVDHCPGCQSTLDLSQPAFAKIANPVAGIINIDYC